MLKKLNAGIGAGLFFAILAIVFFFLALQYPYNSPIGPGSGFFPVWICVILFICSVLLIVESIRNSAEFVEAFLPKGKQLREILLVLGALILYVALINFLGYILSSIIFLFILLCHNYKWYVSLTTSVGVTLFLYLLFKVFLKIPLPANILGF